jgi:hypothetical protein
LDNNWQESKFYKSDRPCCVCGKTINTGIEPRFGYIVCELHSNIAPAYIKEYAKEYRVTHGTIRTTI